MREALKFRNIGTVTFVKRKGEHQIPKVLWEDLEVAEACVSS
jgi:hypothetical protein